MRKSEERVERIPGVRFVLFGGSRDKKVACGLHRALKTLCDLILPTGVPQSLLPGHPAGCLGVRIACMQRGKRQSSTHRILLDSF